MSIATVVTSTAPSDPSVPAARPDLECDRRFAARMTRGIAYLFLTS